MTNALIKSHQQLVQWLASPNLRERLQNALGNCYQADYFVEQLTIAMTREDLLPCTPDSKLKAINICASLGLIPSLQHVALIPRKNKGVPECTVMPQWQGLQALMMRCPVVQSIRHALVHVNDEFEWDGTNQIVARHDFDPFDKSRTFTGLPDIKGGYLKITFKDGRPPLHHIVTRETIQKARRCAQADNIWRDWFEEQAIKTLYRNGYARRVVPIDPTYNHQMETMLGLEDDVLGNDPDLGRASQVIEHRPANRAEAAMRRMGVASAPEPEYLPEPTVPEEQPEPEQPAEDLPTFASVKKLVLKAKNQKQLDEATAKAELIRDSFTDAQDAEFSSLVGDAMTALDGK